MRQAEVHAPAHNTGRRPTATILCHLWLPTSGVIHLRCCQPLVLPATLPVPMGFSDSFLLSLLLSPTFHLPIPFHLFSFFPSLFLLHFFASSALLSPSPAGRSWSFALLHAGMLMQALIPRLTLRGKFRCPALPSDRFVHGISVPAGCASLAPESQWDFMTKTLFVPTHHDSVRHD